jgi:two-component system, OmpR family, response regulator MprA
MLKILVVDDDEKLLKMLTRTLVYEGFDTITATNGRDALTLVQTRNPAILILDWLMPGLDGIGVIRRLRGANEKVPVLMLTARDAIEDRVLGLDSGADDYLVKPFAPAELLARVHALIRRSDAADGEQPLAYADLRLDSRTREAWRGKRKLELTPTEFDLIYFLLRHPRQVLRRDQILQEVWGYDFSGEDNILEVYISYVRKKTEAGGEPRLIQTARGVGYTLREE